MQNFRIIKYLILLALLSIPVAPARTQESGPRELKLKSDFSLSKQKGDEFRPAPTPFPTSLDARAITPIVNIYTKKAGNDKSQCAEPEDWKKWGSFAWCRSFEWVDAERIIAIFTVILGIATWRLWIATQRLVKGAEETSARQLRA